MSVDEGTHCPTCGTYVAHKPRVEMQRNVALRGWDVFTYTVSKDGRERGMQVFVPDREDLEWQVGAPQHLTPGVPIIGPR